MAEVTPYNLITDIAVSDTVDLNRPAQAIYVGSGGDVVAVPQNGAAVTFVGVPTGAILPILAYRVNDSDTDADALVALNYV